MHRSSQIIAALGAVLGIVAASCEQSDVVVARLELVDAGSAGAGGASGTGGAGGTAGSGVMEQDAGSPPAADPCARSRLGEDLKTVAVYDCYVPAIELEVILSVAAYFRDDWQMSLCRSGEELSYEDPEGSGMYRFCEEACDLIKFFALQAQIQESQCRARLRQMQQQQP